jgi:uncharacterized protein
MEQSIMNKLRIAIDLDDVVVDFVAGMVDHYNHVFGTTYQYSDIKYWNLYETLIELETAEGMKAFLDGFVYHPNYLNLEPVEQARTSIKKLVADGHEVFFITSRTSKAIDITYKWLSANSLPIEKVYFNKDKGWLCKQLRIDVHVDDGVHNLLSVHSGSPDTSLILFDRPWNRGEIAKELPIHDRVKNWNDILEIVGDMSGSD